jgi:membrane protein DedA with SNARE-associated domain
MNDTLEFVVRHGYAVLFVWVLAEQLGVPLPAVPMLLAAGALAGAGEINFGIALVIAVAASLISDSIWYELGRRRGSSVLRLLCRISLEPDSCVRRTEEVFARYGARSLLFAKFVPGLNTAAPPLAGIFGMSYIKFLMLNAAGAAIWAGGFGALGYLFAQQIEDVAQLSVGFGQASLWLLVTGLAGYLGWRWYQRRSFVRGLRVARITPEELKKKLDAGEPLTIIDLRHPLDVLPYPQTLPGALRIAPEELPTRQAEIPRDRGIVLYCT